MGSYLSYHYINKPKRMNCTDCTYFDDNPRKSTCRRNPPHAKHWFPEVDKYSGCGELKESKEAKQRRSDEAERPMGKSGIILALLIYGTLILLGVYLLITKIL